MARHPLLRSAVSIAVLAAGLGGGNLAAESPETSPSTVGALSGSIAVEQIVFNDLPAEIEEMAHWAVGLFEQADMELPPLQINHYGDDTSQCEGLAGVRRQGDGQSIIDLCTNDVGFPTQAMVLHEIAHAWVDANVDDEAREAFQALRGYEYWRDYEAAPWHENGTEQAAEIIAWGLFDRPMAMLRINQNSCDELEAGYIALTGEAPLNGLRDRCEA